MLLSAVFNAVFTRSQAGMGLEIAGNVLAPLNAKLFGNLRNGPGALKKKAGK